MGMLVKLGITGAYVLIFGFLARALLNGPRTTGFQPRLVDFFCVGATAILAMLSIITLIERTKKQLGCQPARPLPAAARVVIGQQLIKVAILALAASVALVSLERLPAADPYTPYRPVFCAVSLAAALLVEAIKAKLTMKSF